MLIGDSLQPAAVMSIDVVVAVVVAVEIVVDKLDSSEAVDSALEAASAKSLVVYVLVGTGLDSLPVAFVVVVKRLEEVIVVVRQPKSS